jgi:putative Holliday junction resolvase
MERVMAIDVGERRIGVAASDPLGITAQGITVINRTADLAVDLTAIKKIADDLKVSAIVVGLPKSLSGEEGPQAAKIREFAAELERYVDVPLYWQDERLTTKAAESAMIAGDLSRAKRKTIIDRAAAQLILETFMARRKREIRE